MDPVLEKKIQEFLNQKTFEEIVKVYEARPEVAGLTMVCFQDPKLLRPFVMGIIFSTVSAMVNDHFNGNVPVIELKEAIIMFQKYIEV